MTDTVYIAMVMPLDPDDPVYTRKVGDTPGAAKRAALKSARRRVPNPTLENLDWNDNVANEDGWRFVCKEKKLHKI